MNPNTMGDIASRSGGILDHTTSTHDTTNGEVSVVLSGATGQLAATPSSFPCASSSFTPKASSQQLHGQMQRSHSAADYRPSIPTVHKCHTRPVLASLFSPLCGSSGNEGGSNSSMLYNVGKRNENPADEFSERMDSGSCRGSEQKEAFDPPVGALGVTGKCTSKCSRIVAFKERLLESVNQCFELYVGIVYRHAWMFIFVSMTICLALGWGVILRRVVDSGEEQYALPKSAAQRNKILYRSLFSANLTRSETLIIRSRSNANLVTKEFLDRLWELHQGVLNLTVSLPAHEEAGASSSGVEGFVSEKETTFDAGGVAVFHRHLQQQEALSSSFSLNTSSGIVGVAGESNGQFTAPAAAAPPLHSRTPNGRGRGSSFGRASRRSAETSGEPRGEEAVLVGMAAEEPCDLLKANPKDVVCGLACREPLPRGTWGFQNLCAKDSEGVCVLPEGIIFMYSERSDYGSPIAYPRNKMTKLYTEQTTDMWISPKYLVLNEGMNEVVGGSAMMLRYYLRDDPEMVNTVEAWERSLIEYITQYKDNLDDISVFIMTDASMRKELASSTKLSSLGDMMLVAGTVTLLFGYVAVVSFSMDAYRSKVLSALMGGVAAGLGYIGGAGFCYLLGLEHTNTAAATPFLVLGVGVDDMFVILNSYTLTFNHTSAEERMHIAVKDCGLSITITTLTNLIAFGIGASSPYLSVRNFSILTAGGLFAGYVMALTFYLGWLCIDAQREELRRRLCCSVNFRSFPCMKRLSNPKMESVGAEKKRHQRFKNPAGSTFDLVAKQAAAADATPRSLCAKGFTLEPNRTRAKVSLCETPGVLRAVSEDRVTAATLTTASAVQSLKGRQGSSIHEDSSGKRGELPPAEVRTVKFDCPVLRRAATDELKSASHSTPPSEVSSITQPLQVVEPASEDIIIYLHTNYPCREAISFTVNQMVELLKEEDLQETLEEPTAENHHCQRSDLEENSDCRESWKVTQRVSNFESATESCCIFPPIAMTSKAMARHPRAKALDLFQGGHRCPKTGLLYGRMDSDVGKYKHIDRQVRRVYWNDELLCSAPNSFAIRRSKTSLGMPFSPSNFTSAGEKEDNLEEQELSSEELAEPEGNVGRKWRCFFLQYYGWFITRPIVKLLVLCLFTAYLGISIWGCLLLERGLDMKKLASDDSYLTAFFDTQKDAFVKYGDPVEIFFPAHPDWYSASVKAEYRRFHAFLRTASYTMEIKDGLLEFLDSTLGQDLLEGDSAQHNHMLSVWLNTPRGANFARDFVWNESGSLKSWKLIVVPPYYETSEEQGRFMGVIRTDLARFPTLAPEVYSRMFVFYESDREILPNTMSNMAFAALAMLLVSLLLLPNVWSGVLVIVIIVMIDVGVMGLMHFWDLPLNMLTMVNLIMSIGFSVDYSAHICHTFCHCVGKTRDLRVIETLVLMGNPIFHGAFSTQVAVMMLSCSQSYILRVFFKMMTLVLVLGVSHGVILLPVVLSLIGPMDDADEDRTWRCSLKRLAAGVVNTVGEASFACRLFLCNFLKPGRGRIAQRATKESSNTESPQT